MENVPVFVGLDYHSKSVQVCVLDAGGRVLTNKRCGNSLLEIVQALGPGRRVVRAAIESCCGAADLAERLNDTHTGPGWPITLAHAGYVARMKCNPDKTDYSDARMLAELCRVGMIAAVWLPPLPIRELRLLIRLRSDLVGQGRAAKTRMLAVLRQQRIAEPTTEPGMGRWSKRWLAWLMSDIGLSEQARFVVRTLMDDVTFIKGKIARVDAQLRDATADDDVVKKLRTHKGIGEVTAWTMRALIGRFDRFISGKHLSRFCAVTPQNASSGQRVADSGMVRAGDPQLKSVVIEAAQRLRRYEPRWKRMSGSMQARGKPSSVIVGAVANRWIRSLFHELKEVSAAA